MLQNLRPPPDLGGDAALAFGKSSPAVAVSALSITGVPLERWVVILTVIYLMLQIAWLIYRAVKSIRDGKVPSDG